MLGNGESLGFLAPELLLMAGVIGLFLGDLVVARKERLGDLALLVTGAAVLMIGAQAARPSAQLFGGLLAHDPFAVFFRALFSLATMLVIWMSLPARDVSRRERGTFHALLLAALSAACLMASATNLLMAYLGLEFLSLCSYLLTGLGWRNPRGGEASLKYLVYGAVASAMMVYGLSWLYGLTGSLDLPAVRAGLQGTSAGASLAAFVAVALVLVGLAYKIAAVPFHMWAPDVYAGAPLPVVAFLSVVSKGAGMALLLRLLFPGLSAVPGEGVWPGLPGGDWQPILVLASVATMTLGNLAALTQSHMKRMLAYSGIAHAGYLLMGVAVASREGLFAVVFYLVPYAVMNLGAFLVLQMVTEAGGREDLRGFRGLAWRGGAVPAVALALFLFSLTGLPPLGGFIGKFYLFAAVVKEEFYALALAGVLNSVISLYYYARVVRTMFLDAPDGTEPHLQPARAQVLVLTALALLILSLGIYWAPLATLADRSLGFAG